MTQIQFKYAVFQNEAGEWFFSLAEDLSDPSEPYPTRDAVEKAVEDLLTKSLADIVQSELFGVSQ